MLTSSGALLGGRVAYAQPEEGFRSGIEPVLLAAAVPAHAGERVLEAGTGAGAAMLCVAARVAGVETVGVEQDPALAELARRNATANRLDRASVLTADIADLPDCGVFDHGCANPPYHPRGGTGSPIEQRERSKRGAPGMFAVWASALTQRLRPGGTLTFVLPAATMAEGLAALDRAGCGSLAVLPFWPRAGRPAKLLLLRGVKSGRGACRLLPGLVLHRADGKFTEDAQAILRDGAALPL